MTDQDQRRTGRDRVDTLDTRFAALRGQPPPAPFAPAAALALLGLAAGTVVTANQPEPVTPARPPLTEPPPGTATPAPAEIPGSWLLTAEDLGRGWEPVSGHELFETDPAWYWGGYCQASGAFPEDAFPSLERRLDLEVGSWRSRSPAGPRRLDQLVELFPTAADAAANLRDVRIALETCSGMPAAPDQAPLLDTRTGFGGDEALLVEERFLSREGDPPPAPSVRLVAVVRVGAVVTTLSAPDGSEEEVRELALLAAGRLRSG